MLIRFEKQRPERPADPLMPPARPKAADIRKTPVVFHLIMSIITAGLWLPVWAGHALANRVGNASEQRRYDREMARYKDEVLAWQLRWKKQAEGDWVPQLPE